MVMVDVTTSGVKLRVGLGSVPVAVMAKVAVGVGVARALGASERAIKPIQ